ncbi:MAG: thioredoxin [Hyphomicrobiaceae bacterium]|nr:thioredoxin [Hyphomicrobiaceae bacterium]
MVLGFGKNSDTTSGASNSDDLVKDTTTANFVADVVEPSKSCIVLVDFWADWCGPCKQLAPVLEKVVKSYGGKVRLVKLNVDQHPAIAGQLRIQSLPTVYAFRDGQPVDGFMGAQPESAIKELIDRLIGPDEAAELAEVLAGAEAALEAGDLQTAAQTYASVLQADSQNPEALAGLAKCYLKSGDAVRARQTIALVPPNHQSNAAVAAVKAALDLAEKAPTLTDTSGLEARLSANPADHQARLDLALAVAADGDKERAVDELIELFRRDRNWQDQAARKQLVQFFEAWGPKDPHTLDGRRRLSSLMFA